MEKYIIENKNYYIINSEIDNINIHRIINKNISEYRILLIYKDFSVHDKIILEKKFIDFIESGVIEISLLGKNANILENEIDNILVNLNLLQYNEKFLNIITSSENNLQELESFLYGFYNGGLSLQNKIGYVTDNIIISDDEEILNKILEVLLSKI